MNISPVKLNSLNKPVNFKGLSKKASQKLIAFSKSLSFEQEKECLTKIEALAKKLEKSHTDVTYAKGFMKIYKSSMTTDPEDERIGVFEGLKIINKSNNKAVGFMPIRGLYTICNEIRVDNGGTYQDTEIKDGVEQTKTAQCFGLYPQRFSEFMEDLNEVIDLNEGNVPNQPRSLEEIRASILAHSK